MKKTIILFLIAILIGNYSCERDDLCPEAVQTTASLVMETFDLSLPDDSKNVFGLRIQGVGNDSVLEGFNVVTSNSLILPLRTDADETQYKLHQNYSEDANGNPNGGNEDIITIRYIRNDVFVSRACGFSTIFTNVSITVEDDGDTWIKLIQAENDNQIVEDEAQAHFKLFH